jgi:peroxiredoxin
LAATPSTMMALGTPAPDFRLPDTTSGRDVALADAAGERGTLVMFLCNHCPYVKHVQPELARIGREFPARGIGVVAISSNDVEKYPQDGPQEMRGEARAAGYAFPYLFDETQEIARAYGAACTPDFFLFDAQRRLVYRGQLDASRPQNDLPVTGEDLRAAMEALISGRPVPGEHVPSIGCNIKWKPGNAPGETR